MDDTPAVAEQRRIDAETLIARQRAFLLHAQAEIDGSLALLARINERLRAYREAKEVPE